jgi:large subunit ribosomal protein L29
MALLKTAEIRDMSVEERNEKLKELRNDLMHERGVSAMGGAPSTPGLIRAIRTNIARILTVQNEEEKI